MLGGGVGQVHADACPAAAGLHSSPLSTVHVSNRRIRPKNPRPNSRAAHAGVPGALRVVVLHKQRVGVHGDVQDARDLGLIGEADGLQVGGGGDVDGVGAALGGWGGGRWGVRGGGWGVEVRWRGRRRGCGGGGARGWGERLGRLQSLGCGGYKHVPDLRVGALPLLLVAPQTVVRRCCWNERGPPAAAKAAARPLVLARSAPHAAAAAGESTAGRRRCWPCA